jgi:hypothetical protein
MFTAYPIHRDFIVPRTGDVATKAERVFSAKIEFIRENRAEATESQQ